MTSEAVDTLIRRIAYLKFRQHSFAKQAHDLEILVAEHSDETNGPARVALRTITTVSLEEEQEIDRLFMVLGRAIIKN